MALTTELKVIIEDNNRNSGLCFDEMTCKHDQSTAPYLDVFSQSYNPPRLIISIDVPICDGLATMIKVQPHILMYFHNLIMRLEIK